MSDDYTHGDNVANHDYELFATTNEDYIRKAVELAKGWTYGPGCSVIQPGFGEIQTLGSIEQPYLDALAAQLEREFNEWCSDEPHLRCHSWIEYVRQMRKQPLGTDLTMWRIRYLVDLHE